MDADRLTLEELFALDEADASAGTAWVLAESVSTSRPGQVFTLSRQVHFGAQAPGEAVIFPDLAMESTP